MVVGSRWAGVRGDDGGAGLDVPDSTLVAVTPYVSLVAEGFHGNRGLLL